MDKGLRGITSFLNRGASDGTYPGAVLLVAHRGEEVLSHTVGNRTLIPEPLPLHHTTLFDLASLTKPLATTLAVMKLMDDGKVDLDQPLPDLLLPASVPEDKANVTLSALLSHCAGFENWRPFYLDPETEPRKNRKALVREKILNTPLLYPPHTATLYSDLGFMVLEWVIEAQAGLSLPEYLRQRILGSLSLKHLFFYDVDATSPFENDRFAATEECPWRKAVMTGVVQDENAYFMGGYSGHAGLFGNIEDVYALTNLLREHHFGDRHDLFSPETVRAFFTRQDLVAGSTWALGWDTPSRTESSSGKYFSEETVGHLGFTGTSIWMDLAKDVIVILLTNRIHPTRENEKIRQFRPLLHNRVMEALGLDK
ncbi:MAG: serine hydrolase [Deltaproteobacteria bacterium]|nr:serine hydrolase [Deltaproteobacteria bacterium]